MNKRLSLPLLLLAILAQGALGESRTAIPAVQEITTTDLRCMTEGGSACPPRIPGVPRGPRPDTPPFQQPPTGNQTGGDAQPLYFFLFTHTEDPFNHELSEERYLRLVPEVEARAATYPEANLVWTIMFQGTDARSVAERNHLGTADTLRAANHSGVVRFGYHAHHEATYQNRPQNDFTEDTPWETLVQGMVEWLGCLKELSTGDCIAPEGGGITAVESLLGPVEVVSGDFLVADSAYKGGPTSHAALKLLPSRIIGFGYPDHGPFGQAGRREQVARLMERLTPTQETSSSLYWADNVLNMNGGSPMDGVAGIDPLLGPLAARGKLQQLDRSRPHIVLTGLASKFLYTRQDLNTSPTIYGYAHPDAPELPPELLNSEAEKEQFYQQSLDTLDYLLTEVLPENPGSRFISSDELLDMVAPPEYWLIDEERLRKMAAWALLHWTDRPPDWVSDGRNFYSLRDLFTLLTMALAERDRAVTDTRPIHLAFELPLAYGPLEVVDASRAVSLPVEEILDLSRRLAPDFAYAPDWEITPRAMLQPVYSTSRGDVTVAQLLYGMALIYTDDDLSTEPVTTVSLPVTRAMPVTYDLLRDIGCLNTCSGTAWSFKPAPIRQNDVTKEQKENDHIVF